MPDTAYLPSLKLVQTPQHRSVTEPQLEQILDGSSRFTFHFQPIVDLQHGATAGFEALARFPTVNGSLAPNLVFEMASVMGLRFDLEDLVLRRAIATRQLLPRNCFLSLNVGPGFLLSNRFDQLIAEVPTLAGAVFEITQDEVITDYPAIQKKLASIRMRGGSIAVDDAGAGYSSLTRVMEFRPNFIKLDRAFVHNCDSDPAKAVLIDILCKAANRLDACLIAEGIETPGELDELIRLGVPLGQGFHLARPQVGMGLIADAMSTEILSRSTAFTSRTGLQRSLEFPVVCSSRFEAEAKLHECSSCQLAIILDEASHPIEAIERHPLLGMRSVPQMMKVQLNSEATEVLHRALTRPCNLRHDPLIVINTHGRFEGYIQLDRLMREIMDLLAPRSELQTSVLEPVAQSS